MGVVDQVSQAGGYIQSRPTEFNTLEVLIQVVGIETKIIKLAVGILNHADGIEVSIGNANITRHPPGARSGIGNRRIENDAVIVRFLLDLGSPACLALRESGQALAIFSGPNSYISPDWYGNGACGPSWNYLTAEAEGQCVPLDPAECVAFFDELASFFERKLWPKEPWHRQQVDPAKFENMISTICAFDLTAERFEGTRKLSQNHGRDARKSAGEALALAGGDPAIAAMMMNDIF